MARVVDCYSKKLIGYTMAENCRTELTNITIGCACLTHTVGTGSIIHTNRAQPVADPPGSTGFNQVPRFNSAGTASPSTQPE